MYSPYVTACVFDIYQQQIPEMDMYSYLLRWKAFLEFVIGRKLAPDQGGTGIEKKDPGLIFLLRAFLGGLTN